MTINDQGSHHLICQESYTNTYKRIKEKWGRDITKVFIYKKKSKIFQSFLNFIYTFIKKFF